MTTLIRKIYSFSFGKNERNPVHQFFVESSSREKKKAYTRALKLAQKDQKKILDEYDSKFVHEVKNEG